MILASNVRDSSQNWELFDTEELVGEFGCIYVRALPELHDSAVIVRN